MKKPSWRTSWTLTTVIADADPLGAFLAAMIFSQPIPKYHSECGSSSFAMRCRSLRRAR